MKLLLMVVSVSVSGLDFCCTNRVFETTSGYVVPTVCLRLPRGMS